MFVLLPVSELTLPEWQKHGFAQKRKDLTDIEAARKRDTVTRINYDEVSKEEFIERFEKPGQPVVILGCTEGWKANAEWTLEACDWLLVVLCYKCSLPRDML
jgi:histone arginine demethylase JMJD6